MKKLFNLKRVKALIVSAVLLVTCFSAGFTSSALSANMGTFTFANTAHGTVVNRDNGWHDVTFKAGYVYLTSNYKIDLTKGVQLKYSTFAKTHISFLSATDATPYATTLIFYKSGNNLKATSNPWKLDSNVATSVDTLLNIKFVLVSDSYKLYINDVAFNYTIPEADFNTLNNYNSESGSFDGCYLRFYPESTPKFSIAPIREQTIPTDKPFAGDGYNYGTKYPYNVSIGGWQKTVTTWRTDLTKGLTFNLSAHQTGWVTIAISGDYFNMAAGANGSNDYTWFLYLKVYDTDKINAVIGSDEKRTGLSINETHTLSFKQISEGGVDKYKAYIDDVPLSGGNSVITKDIFERVNNANSTIGDIGAYIRLGSEAQIQFRDIAPTEWVKANLGNVNNDGDVATADDIIILCDYLVSKDVSKTGFTSLLADVNEDDLINTQDLIKIKKISANTVA